MKRISITFLVALSIVVIGCKQRDGYVVQSNKLIYKSYYQNGKLEKELTFDLDTVLNGESVYYYEDGIEARKCHYENGKLNGVDSLFYSTGNLYMYQQWYDSLLIHDKLVFYDSISPMLVEQNGDTSIIKYPLIKNYIYFNSQGSVGFNIEYDQNLNLKNISGDAIVSVFLDSISYKFTFVVVTPPFYDGIFSVSNDNGNLENKENYRALTVLNNKVEYDIEPDRSTVGSGFSVKYILMDNENRILTSDIVEIVLNGNKFSMKRMNDEVKMVL